MLNCNGFTIENEVRFPSEPVFASRDGKKWLLSPCPNDMTGERVSEILHRFKTDILAGGNIPVPEYFSFQDRWICAEIDQNSLLDGYGLRYFPLVSSVHRQRILLSAVNALQTLHNAGLIHGSLCHTSFRVTESSDGSFRVSISELNYLMPVDFGNYYPGYPSGYKAPDCNVRYVSRKTDIYALGVVFYYWICGRMPMRNNNRLLLIPDSIPSLYGQLISAMMNPTPNARPGSDQVIAFLKGGTDPLFDNTEYRNIHVHGLSSMERDDLMVLLEQECRSFDVSFPGRVQHKENW